MGTESTDSRAKIAMVLAWPAVALAALLLFQTQIAAILPGVKKFSAGNVAIEMESPLGAQATPDVQNALEDLTPTSVYTLITRSLAVTCFYEPLALGAQPIREEHAQLVRKGLIEEIPGERLATQCRDPNPVIGLRRTELGERTRSFQLAVLEELTKPPRQ